MQALTFYASDDKLENRGNSARIMYTVRLQFLILDNTLITTLGSTCKNVYGRSMMSATIDLFTSTVIAQFLCFEFVEY